MKYKAAKFFGLIFFGLFALDQTMNRGFCFSEWRVVPDDELLLSGMYYEIGGKGLRPSEMLQSDRDEMKAYLKEHTDCCRVLPWSDVVQDRKTYSKLDWMFGYYTSAVEIRKRELRDGQWFSIGRVIPLDSCGTKSVSASGIWEPEDN